MKYKIWWDKLKLICTLRPMYAQINSTDFDHYYTEKSIVGVIYSIER